MVRRNTRTAGSARLLAVAVVQALCLLPAALAESVTDIAWERVLDGIVDRRYVSGAYSGGIEDGQLAVVDIDADGDADLFLTSYQEQEGRNRLELYQNVGTPGNPVWSSPEVVLPPQGAVGFPTFCDIDGDGDRDLFMGANGSIWFYENTGTVQQFAFAPAVTNYGGMDFNIYDYSLSMNCIRFADIDNDGLQDAFITDTWGFSGGTGTIAYYHNTGTVWFAQWELVTTNFGNIAFPISGGVGNGADLAFCDIDHDLDQDLFLSRDSSDNLYFYENTGTASAAVWAAPTTNIAGRSITSLGSPAFADIDADGNVDLLGMDQRTKAPVLLGNRGTPEAMSWGSAVTNYTMLDVGIFSSAAFGDLDGDGDSDLLLGGRRIGRQALVFLENVGSPAVAVWARPDTGYLTNLFSGTARPALVDIDHDGDLDLFVGELGGDSAGVLVFYENTGTTTAAAWAGPVTNVVDTASTRNLAPAFADIDGDGDEDLFIGGRPGNLLYYENTGTASVAAWAPAVANYSNIATAAGTDPTSVPYFGDLDGDSDLDLVLGGGYGTYGGAITLYENVGTPAVASWIRRTNSMAGIDVGLESAPALCDIDGDGDLDLFVGERAGGLNFWRNRSAHLAVDPGVLTLVAGESWTLSVTGTTGAVTWGFVTNRSGAAVLTNATSATYTAGSTAPAIDVVQATDATQRFGRCHINVISTNDATLAGKAVIIAGGKSLADPVWKATDLLARRAFNTLRLRGYAKQNIRYFSFDYVPPGKDVDGNLLPDDVFTNTSLAEISNTFDSVWIHQTDRLFVYMVDHGSDAENQGFMRLNQAENLSATELGSWLDDLQDNYGVDVTVVMDFCYAGSFLDELAYAGSGGQRTVIASTRKDELAYFVAGGLFSFSGVFFSGLLQGLDVVTAFDLARGSMDTYQHAQLDDTMDGAYDPFVDGSAGATNTIGATFLAGRDLPQIGTVMPYQILTNATEITLWVTDISSVYPLNRVWAAVVPPNHGAGLATGIPVVDIPEVELHYNAGTDRYEGLLDGFSEPGPYAIIVHAQDIWGGISLPKQTYVEQEGFDERAIVFVSGPSAAGGMWTQTYFDATGDLYDGSGGGIDFSGNTHLDISSVQVSQTLTALVFNISVNRGSITSPDDWGKYAIGMDTGPGGDTTGDGWGRPIAMDSGMDYWIAGWVDFGGGVQVWHYDNVTTNWALIRTLGIATAGNTVTYTVSLADLNLRAGDAFAFDVYSTGPATVDNDSAVDALSVSNHTITQWGEYYDSGTNVSAFATDGGFIPFNNIGRLAYHTLRARRLPAGRIWYLNPWSPQDVDQDGTNDIFAAPSLAVLAYAITNWAASTNSGGPADKLTIYLAGEGISNRLQVGNGEELDSAALDTWLDAFQASGAAAYVIMDFAGCGAFVTNLVPPSPDAERIVVAGTRAYGPCLVEEDGTVSFSQFLLEEIYGGATLGNAVTTARKAIRRASLVARQRAGIDDDGDGIWNEKNVDGIVARSRYIGTAFVTGEDAPLIGAVMPPVYLEGTNETTIWAADVTDVNGIAGVWCAISGPDSTSTNSLVHADLAQETTSNRWEAHVGGFTNPGVYVLTFYAEDAHGEVSSPVQSQVVRGDLYEPDNVYTQAAFYDGSPQLHTFHASNDVDWVKFYAVSNFAYDIETFHFGANIDTVLDLYRLASNGTLALLDHVDEFGFDEGELTGLDFPTNGWYYVAVGPYASNTFGQGGYDLLIEIPAGGSPLVVVAGNGLTGGPLPAGSEARLDGTLPLAFGGETSVVYTNPPPGSHLVSVTNVPAGYFPEEDTERAGQVQNPDNETYGNPRSGFIESDPYGAWRCVAFLFNPYGWVGGSVCDRWTGEVLDDVHLAFTARNGAIAGYIYDGYPNYASYAARWYTAADGGFPADVRLPTVDWDLTVSRSGYVTTTLEAVVTGLAAGDTAGPLAVQMQPVDENGNFVADAWEVLHFGSTTNVLLDHDGDGIITRDEYYCGTDPTNDADVLEIVTPQTNGTIKLTWPVVAGRTYRVGSSTAVEGRPWSVAAGPWSVATNGYLSWSGDPNEETSRVYRVELLSTP